jgi:hypothetical protein
MWSSGESLMTDDLEISQRQRQIHHLDTYTLLTPMSSFVFVTSPRPVA